MECGARAHTGGLPDGRRRRTASILAGIAAGLLCGLVQAQEVKTLRWTPPTERVDGTALSADQLAAHRVLCDPGVDVSVPMPATSWAGVEPGIASCVVRAVDQDGLESVDSERVFVEWGGDPEPEPELAPGQPVALDVSVVELPPATGPPPVEPPPDGGGGVVALYSNDFASYTPGDELGADSSAWNLAASTWLDVPIVSGPVASGPSSGAADAGVLVDNAVFNADPAQTVEITVDAKGTANDIFTHIVLRGDPTSGENYLAAVYRGTGVERYEVWRVSNNGQNYSSLGVTTSSRLSVPHTFAASIDTAGGETTIIFYIDGVQAATFTDDSGSQITTGQPGFGFYLGETCEVSLFEAWDGGYADKPAPGGTVKLPFTDDFDRTESPLGDPYTQIAGHDLACADSYAKASGASSTTQSACTVLLPESTTEVCASIDVNVIGIDAAGNNNCTVFLRNAAGETYNGSIERNRTSGLYSWYIYHAPSFGSFGGYVAQGSFDSGGVPAWAADTRIALYIVDDELNAYVGGAQVVTDRAVTTDFAGGFLPVEAALALSSQDDSDATLIDRFAVTVQPEATAQTVAVSLGDLTDAAASFGSRVVSRAAMAAAAQAAVSQAPRVDAVGAIAEPSAASGAFGGPATVAAGVTGDAAAGTNQSAAAAIRATTAGTASAGSSQSAAATIAAALTGASTAGESIAGASIIRAGMTGGVTVQSVASGVASMAAQLAATAHAGAEATAAATISATITEPAGAGEAVSRQSAVLDQMVAAADADALLSAYLQAVAALAAGVEAGDAWASRLTAAATLSGAAEAGAEFSEDSVALIAEQSDAGAQFAAAVHALAAQLEEATAGAAMAGIVSTLAAFSSASSAGAVFESAMRHAGALQAGAEAGASFAGVTGELTGLLLESVSAAMVVSSAHQARAAWSATAHAGASFVASGDVSALIGALAFVVAAEQRVFTVPAETRTFIVS